MTNIKFEEYFVEKTKEQMNPEVYAYMNKCLRAFTCCANIISQTFRLTNWWERKSEENDERIRKELKWYVNPWWKDMHDHGVNVEDEITIKAIKMAAIYNQYLDHHDKTILSKRIPGAIDVKNTFALAGI